MSAIDPRLHDDEARCDLTPMIDMIFLLLIFFVLSTRFLAPEKALRALLPTEQGGTAAPSSPHEAPIRLCLLPAGISNEAAPSELSARWKAGALDTQQVQLRIGALTGLLDGAALSAREPERQAAAIATAHALVASALTQQEIPARPRHAQVPVEIHCFSGLAWKFALTAYDAAQAYEQRLSDASTREGRAISFAGPALRGQDELALGDELWRLAHGR